MLDVVVTFYKSDRVTFNSVRTRLDSMYAWPTGDINRAVEQKKLKLGYVSTLVRWLLDADMPKDATWACAARDYATSDGEKEAGLFLSMLEGTWAPPSGRNKLLGTAEITAAIFALFAMVSENLHVASMDSLVEDCDMLNTEQNVRVKARCSATPSEFVWKDYANVARWKEQSAWFKRLLPCDFVYTTRVLTGFFADPVKCKKSIGAIATITQKAVPPPPRYVPKRAREADARLENAKKLAAGVSGDPLDAEFGEVVYEPSSAPEPKRCSSNFPSNEVAAQADAAKVDEESDWSVTDDEFAAALPLGSPSGSARSSVDSNDGRPDDAPPLWFSKPTSKIANCIEDDDGVGNKSGCSSPVLELAPANDAPRSRGGEVKKPKRVNWHMMQSDDDRYPNMQREELEPMILLERRAVAYGLLHYASELHKVHAHGSTFQENFDFASTACTRLALSIHKRAPSATPGDANCSANGGRAQDD